MTCVSRLLAAGADLPVESPRLESEILLAHCLGESRSWLYAWPEKEVDEEREQRFRALLAARRTGEPVAYLLGEREFWSLKLRVNQHTLIPRADTETLVEWALALELPADARVLDLGTGSGAIALALAHERPGWDVTGTDLSPAALAVAATNAKELQLERVHWLQSNWCAALPEQQFDLIVSNPPYIEEGDPHLQRGDLRFEPETALASGEDGLDAIRLILEQAPALLAPGGWLLLEHGYRQAAAVRELLAAAGLQNTESRQDLAGHARISGGRT